MTPNGLRKKYFSPACKNRMKQRRHRAKEKRLAKRNQQNLKFQPAAKPERRKKGRAPVEPKPVEESMFA